jgi:hypothetical protein
MKLNRNWENLTIEKRKPISADLRNLNMAVLRVEIYVKPVHVNDNLNGRCVKLNRRPYFFK